MTADKDLQAQRSPPIHMASLLLHAAAGALRCLLVMLLLRMRAWAWLAGLVAGLVGSVHPASSEAIGTAVGLAETLVSALVWASLLALLLWQQRGGLLWCLAHVVCLALALLSKENAVVVVVAAPVMLGLVGSRGWKRALLASLPALGVTLGWLLLRLSLLGSLGHVADPVYADFPLGARLATALAVIGSYDLPGLFTCAWYLPNVSFQDISPAEGFGDPRALLGLACLLLWVALVARAWRRDGLAALGLLFFGAALFPVTNLLLPIGAIAATRFLYLPLGGLALALASVTTRLWAQGGRLRVGLAAAALIWFLPISAYLGVSEARIWRDRASLWSRSLERSQSAVALRSLAVVLREGGQDARSLRIMESAAAQHLVRIPGGKRIPENILEVAFMCNMDAATSRTRPGPLHDVARAWPFARRALELADLGLAQAGTGSAHTAWPALQADALLLQAQLLFMRAAGSAVQRVALVGQAQVLLERARKLAPLNFRVRMLLVNRFSVLGDARRHALEFGKLVRESRPHWADNKTAFETAWSYADWLDQLGRKAQSLRLRCQVAAQGHRWLDRAGLFNLGRLAARTPAARDLAAAVLAAFVQEALPEDGRQVAQARRLLAQLR